MQKRLIPLAILSILGLSLFFFSQAAKNNPPGSSKPARQSVSSLKELSHFTGIDFPAESKIVRSEHLIGEQEHLYAVLHMSHQAALEFTRKLYQQGYSVSKTGSNLPASFNPWLAKQEKAGQPVSLNTIRNYRAMELATQNRSGSLLADFDRPKAAVLYVYYEIA